MALATWFRRRPDRPEASILKAHLRALLGLGDADALTISEIACAACGPDGIETVVLVMREGQPTVALKCLRTMAELAAEPALLVELSGEEDLHAARR